MEGEHGRALAAQSIYALDGQAGGDLDDQGVIALHRGVPTGPRRRPHVRRELPLQIVALPLTAAVGRGLTVTTANPLGSPPQPVVSETAATV